MVVLVKQWDPPSPNLPCQGNGWYKPSKGGFMVLLYKHSAASSDPHRLRAAHGSKGGYPLANHDDKRGCSHCGWESYSKSGIAVCYVMCMIYRYIEYRLPESIPGLDGFSFQDDQLMSGSPCQGAKRCWVIAVCWNTQEGNSGSNRSIATSSLWHADFREPSGCSLQKRIHSNV